MIPPEQDDTMLVTITVGTLYAMIEKAVEKASVRAAHKATEEVLLALPSFVKNMSAQSDEVLVGGNAIAKAIGVDRSTLYRLNKDGKLGDSIRRIGTKLFARRSELLNAIKHSQE